MVLVSTIWLIVSIGWCEVWFDALQAWASWDLILWESLLVLLGHTWDSWDLIFLSSKWCSLFFVWSYSWLLVWGSSFKETERFLWRRCHSLFFWLVSNFGACHGLRSWNTIAWSCNSVSSDRAWLVFADYSARSADLAPVLTAWSREKHVLRALMST